MGYRRGATVGLFHLMARGNNRANVFLDDGDRAAFVRLLDSVGGSLGWRQHAYCLMDNHFHLLTTVPDDNLSDGMRDVLAKYARQFNRRRNRTGHVFSERFRSVEVESDDQFVTVAQYIARNPVRAGLVTDPRDWPWSSVAHETPAPLSSLDVEALLRVLHPNAALARDALVRLILTEPRDSRASPASIVAALGVSTGIPAAYGIGYSQREIAEATGISASTVSRLVQGDPRAARRLRTRTR